MSSPGINSSRILKKINIISSRPRPFRVTILGQNGVGKTAFTVRFVTRRYIGEYDPLLERVYSCQRTMNDSSVEFEVWDTAGVNENCKLKEPIRWADAVILMYDVTDRCSFNECSRLKFLVNAHSRRSRRKTGSDPQSEINCSIPVILVGNKKDREKDRMVRPDEGAARCNQLTCISFYEVSVQEDVDDIIDIFEELYTMHRKQRKYRMSLTASKSSIFMEKACSSSDEDNNNDGVGGGGNGGGGGGGSDGGGGGEDGGGSRRGTLTSATSDNLSQDDLIRRSRSRRREAFYTIS